MKKGLQPLFKWTGGKRREIKIFGEFFPEFVKGGNGYSFVEPFAGGAAVFWHLNNISGDNWINDYDPEVINFYHMMREQGDDFINPIWESSALYGELGEHSKQEENYYRWRNMDRDGGLDDLTAEERAARFWIVNQLSFSGMRRFNKKGEFNVPYGHYKRLNSSSITSAEHVKLLEKTRITNDDYSEVIEQSDNDNTFIFLDPPYTRVMKTYSSDNEFGVEQQHDLRDQITALGNASWMLVIDHSELTEELYRDYICGVYDLKYGVNIRNRFDTGVKHLIVSNYLTPIDIDEYKIK